MKTIIYCQSNISICRWDECPAYHSSFEFCDASVIELSLQHLKTDQSAIESLRNLLNGIDMGYAVSRLDDSQVIHQIAELVSSGQLRLCTDNVSNTKIDTSTAKQATITQVLSVLEKKIQNLNFDNRTLRIINVHQWEKPEINQHYKILPQAEAQKILQQVALSPSSTENEKNALQQAIKMIPDTRFRKPENGLLLLQYIPMSYSKSTSTEPAISPSELKKLSQKEEHWIELKLLDTENHPVPWAKYRIELPDKSIREGTLDQEGLAWIGNIKAGGKCKVIFPEFDIKEWA